MARTARSTLALLALVALLAFPATGRAQALLAGELSGDDFGAAVRGVGDLNGDGEQDFAVGAPGQDAFGSEAGAVYIFFGRPENAAGGADIVLRAGDGGDRFGAAVAGIGRFNADAYDDLAVGAPDSDAGGAGRGRVHIYYGGPSKTSLTIGPILSGIQGGDHFGTALDGGFDFDNDGFDDLAVGAPDNPGAGQRAGHVLLFRGGSSPSTTAARTLNGEQAEDQFGRAVRRAGDVNNDGFGDFVVGAPQPFASNSGRAYVVFGRGDGAAPVRLTLTGTLGGSRFGWDVAGGGDLDADGFDDVAVGAPRHNFGASTSGAVFVFRGGATMNAVSDGQVGGRAAGDEMGTSVSISGDWNRDGRADLVAGGPLSDDGATAAGEANLWLGLAPLDAASREVFIGPRVVPGFAAEDAFGSSVDFVDYNGDGYFEFLGGAPNANQADGDESGYAALHFFPGTFVAVRLADFTAVPEGSRIRLTWRAADDGELLGFHVERRTGPAWRRLTVEWLTAPDGRYAFTDTDPDIAAGGVFSYRLVAVTRGGHLDTFGPFTVAAGPSARPLLDPGYPNPARAGVTIPIVLPESAAVTVELFDTVGRAVRRLFSGSLPAGRTNLWWDGTDDAGTRLPAGSYWYRLDDGRTVASRKVVILR